MDYKPKITTFPHFFTLSPNNIREEAENWEIKGIIQGDEQKNEPKHYELYNQNTNDTIYIKCKNIDEIISKSPAGVNKSAMGGSKKHKRTQKSKRKRTKKSKRNKRRKNKTRRL